MANAVFLNYDTSYFDLLSQRIDDNEAEITDVVFQKLNKPDPIVANALLYVKDADGNTASSSILCQSNNALQSVGCLQLPGTSVNPATIIPELSGKSATTVWLNSTNGHLYRGSVDLETSGSGGDVVGSASSTDNALVRFDGITGKLIQNSLTTLDNTGYLDFPVIGTPLRMDNRTLLGIDRTTGFLGVGRNSNRDNMIMVGNVNTEDSNTVSNGIIIGNDSCMVASGEQNDIIVVGNNVGTSNGSLILAFGNRICLEPTSISQLGSSNILLGHNIDVRNSSNDNILVGHNSKVRGLRNILMGDYVFSSGNSGSDNVVFGYEAAAGFVNNANNNVFVGSRVMTSAPGSSANNIMIGANVGSAITTFVNDCLWLEADGIDGETNTTRIGKSTKTKCHISGIHSQSAPSSTQKNVKINSDGRLVGTFETRPYGCHTASISTLTNGLASLYSIAYTSPSSFKIVMGVSPTSYFSSDGLFVAGTTVGSIRYVGTAPVLVKYTWGVALTASGNVATFYLLKNNVFVPNTVCTSNYMLSGNSAPSFITTLITNDVLEIGASTGTTMGIGNINVFTENRFVEIIA